MKKFIFILFIISFLSFNMLIIPSIAQPKVFREGIYSMESLNLSPYTTYTIKNISPNEYTYLILFDANQIVQQLIQLKPQSEEYNLLPIRFGSEIVIVGKGEIVIS